MARKIRVLLTNDDGIHAAGLRSLYQGLASSEDLELFIIAPSQERSGAGASISWDRPVLIEKASWEWSVPAWSVDGTPADCVKMGLAVLLDSPPDIILSGINAGSNAGRNVLHSGTVGAVIEGVFRGIPGAALSCESGQTPHFAAVVPHVRAVLDYLLTHPLPNGMLLNVNFPEKANGQIKGFKLAQQGAGRWIEEPVLHLDTERGPSYLLGGKPEEISEKVDGDIALLREGYVTIAPIQVHDLTHAAFFASRASECEKFFNMDVVQKRGFRVN